MTHNRILFKYKMREITSSILRYIIYWNKALYTFAFTLQCTSTASGGYAPLKLNVIFGVYGLNTFGLRSSASSTYD